jgi:hypothetical protein
MVNTFLIGSSENMIKSFKFTAKILDPRRKHKNCVETMEIINIIEGKNNKTSYKQGYSNHPCVNLWISNLDALKLYYNTILRYCIEKDKINTDMKYYDIPDEDKIQIPWFLNFMPLIYSHRARLYQKDPKYYADKFDFPKEYLEIGYIWLREGQEECEKAKTFKQISKLADPLNDKYKNCRYCPAILKSGPNAGTECGLMLKEVNDEFCGRHRDKSIPIPICQATKANGEDCKNKAKVGNYCGVHKSQNK